MKFWHYRFPTFRFSTSVQKPLLNHFVLWKESMHLRIFGKSHQDNCRQRHKKLFWHYVYNFVIWLVMWRCEAVADSDIRVCIFLTIFLITWWTLGKRVHALLAFFGSALWCNLGLNKILYLGSPMRQLNVKWVFRNRGTLHVEGGD